MFQVVFETIFHIFYLSLIIVLGMLMIIRGKQNMYFKLFGYMALILGVGDSFHLIPRIYALLTTGLEDHAFSLGFGTFIASITMTIFYVIFYEVWKIRFNVQNTKNLRITIYALGLIRIILCFFPQNEWFIHDSPVSWAIYRNIPFTIIGLIIIYLCYKKALEYQYTPYKHIALAMFLSFLFYLPVAIWASTYPLIGTLMIPKSLAYVWIVLIGFQELRSYKKTGV